MAGTDLTTTIANAAQGVASVNIDGNQVNAVDVSKIIQADGHLAANAGVAKRHRGLRFTKLIPPGTVYEGRI